MPTYAQNPSRYTFVWPWQNKDKDSKYRGNKDIFLPSVLLSCLSSLYKQPLYDVDDIRFLRPVVWLVRLKVAEIPGPDCEEQSSTIDYRLDWQPKNSSPSISCLLIEIGSTDNAFTQSIDAGNPDPATQTCSPDKAVSSFSSKRNSTFTTDSLRQKLKVLDYVKAHSEADASRHFGIPRTTLRGWKELEALPGAKRQNELGESCTSSLMSWSSILMKHPYIWHALVKYSHEEGCPRSSYSRHQRWKETCNIRCINFLYKLLANYTAWKWQLEKRTTTWRTNTRPTL